VAKSATSDLQTPSLHKRIESTLCSSEAVAVSVVGTSPVARRIVKERKMPVIVCIIARKEVEHYIPNYHYMQGGASRKDEARAVKEEAKLAKKAEQTRIKEEAALAKEEAALAKKEAALAKREATAAKKAEKKVAAAKKSLKKSTKKKAPGTSTRKLKGKKLTLVEVDDGVLVQEEKLKAACERHAKKTIADGDAFSDRDSSRKLKSKTSKTVKAKMASTKARTLKRKLTLVEKLPVTTDVKSSRPEETMSAPKPKSAGHRYNEEFIDLLGQLRAIMMQQGEPFRARAYQKAMESIMVYPGDITSAAQIKGLSGVGNITLAKMQEYVETGKIAKLEKEKNNPINVLTQIYGVGPKKAKELIDMGITTIAELKTRQDETLNEAQKVGLKYLDDINARIPREEIVRYEKALSGVFDKVTVEGSRFEIVGSFRRGAAHSGDIDIIVTNESNNKKGSFDAFLDKLIQDGFVTHVLSRGAHKSLTLAKLPGEKVSRRVDFLYTTPTEFPFAILYFTGSKVFNTIMRQRALDMGYSLNEHGLSKMIAGKKTTQIADEFGSEQDIFKFLGMKYKKPEERKDGRAVELSKPGEVDEVQEDVAPAVKRTIVKGARSKTLKKPPVVKGASVEKMAADFKEKGIDAVKALSEVDLSKLLVAAQKAYTNEKPFLTDGQYDVVKEYVEREYPDNDACQLVGAACAPTARNKVTLPHMMFSMNKIKPDTGALPKWKASFPGKDDYEISGKLDGVSGMYSTEGETPKLYTRGNGKIGQDISHIIPHLNLPKTKGIVVRGEFLIPKAVFEEKYAAEFSNPRNLVAGIINALKKADVRKYRDLDFVAYEVIVPELKPSEQMAKLEELGFKTVAHETIPAKTLTNEYLSGLLKMWRTDYKYEIDGVIVSDNKVYPRKEGNPEQSFAFKMVLSDQVAEAKVLNVIWTPSKDGYLKPRVQIEPVVLGGANIEFATAFNAKFVEENKLGVGAVIELIRSGDVIPHIQSVITPAEDAQMPLEPYVWNPTHVDVMLEDAAANEIVREKNILVFFRTLDVDGIGAGNVKRLVDAGFDTVPKILALQKEDFLKAEGFKGKLAQKVWAGIKEATDGASLPALMQASNVFGRGLGQRKFKPILDAFPNVLTSSASPAEKKKMIGTVKGMGPQNVDGFVDSIPKFVKFMKEAGLASKLDYVEEAPQGDASDPLYGKEVMMTGFRDKALIAEIEARGGKLGSSVKTDTVALLVKDLDEDTGKAEQARKKGVPIMTVEQFKEKYGMM